MPDSVAVDKLIAKGYVVLKEKDGVYVDCGTGGVVVR